MQKTNEKKRNVRNLVTSRLENVSKDVFRRYYSSVTDLIGSSPGVYALYDENMLYYVGKSTDLRKRVKHHLRDRHYANWTHFSLYLVRRSEHIHEIESLLIRISNPKGNRIKPKGNLSSKMLRTLKAMIKQKQKDELNLMFGNSKKKLSKSKTKVSHPKTLEGFVPKRTQLYREYKGKEYKAFLTTKGIIKLGNKIYTSPSGAAGSILKRPVNGWSFWYIKNTDGDWVKLRHYK